MCILGSIDVLFLSLSLFSTPHFAHQHLRWPDTFVWLRSSMRNKWQRQKIYSWWSFRQFYAQRRHWQPFASIWMGRFNRWQRPPSTMTNQRQRQRQTHIITSDGRKFLVAATRRFDFVCYCYNSAKHKHNNVMIFSYIYVMRYECALHVYAFKTLDQHRVLGSVLCSTSTSKWQLFFILFFRRLSSSFLLHSTSSAIPFVLLSMQCGANETKWWRLRVSTFDRVYDTVNCENTEYVRRNLLYMCRYIIAKNSTCTAVRSGGKWSRDENSRMYGGSSSSSVSISSKYPIQQQGAQLEKCVYSVFTK